MFGQDDGVNDNNTIELRRILDARSSIFPGNPSVSLLDHGRYD